jgi:hypothetical protein
MNSFHLLTIRGGNGTPPPPPTSTTSPRPNLLDDLQKINPIEKEQKKVITESENENLRKNIKRLAVLKEDENRQKLKNPGATYVSAYATNERKDILSKSIKETQKKVEESTQLRADCAKTLGSYDERLKQLGIKLLETICNSKYSGSLKNDCEKVGLGLQSKVSESLLYLETVRGIDNFRKLSPENKQKHIKESLSKKDNNKLIRETLEKELKKSKPSFTQENINEIINEILSEMNKNIPNIINKLDKLDDNDLNGIIKIVNILDKNQNINLELKKLLLDILVKIFDSPCEKVNLESLDTQFGGKWAGRFFEGLFGVASGVLFIGILAFASAASMGVVVPIFLVAAGLYASALTVPIPIKIGEKYLEKKEKQKAQQKP